MILLLEPDGRHAEIVKSLLARERQETIITVSGAETIELLDERPMDLLILESDLDDMHGLEVVRELRGRPHLRQLPVVICTASVQLAHIEEARTLGVAAYIKKPMDLKSFVLRVGRVLSASPPRWDPRTATMARLNQAGLSRPQLLKHCMEQLDDFLAKLGDGLYAELPPPQVRIFFASILQATSLVGGRGMVQGYDGLVAADGAIPNLDHLRAALRCARTECADELWRTHRVRTAEVWM